MLLELRLYVAIRTASFCYTGYTVGHKKSGKNVLLAHHWLLDLFEFIVNLNDDRAVLFVPVFISPKMFLPSRDLVPRR